MLNDEYDDMDLIDILNDKPRPRYDFPDDHLLRDKAILLKRLSDAEACRMGRQVIPMLASAGISKQEVGTIMLLAYQLRDPADTNKFVLEGAEGLALEQDVAVGELSDEVMVQGAAVSLPLRSIGDDKAEAMAYAYIAASTLRLYTKPEENYKHSFNHILLGYSKYYRVRIPIRAPPAPSMEALGFLSHCYRRLSVFKGTMYRILYLGGGTTTAVELRESLYESHLANTGMHIVGIFPKLIAVLGCTPEALLQVMDSPRFRREIRALRSVVDLEMNADGKHSRGMWRYGRVFDEAFMSPLQTKRSSSLTLTYVLASALKNEAPESNKDILKITQFASINEKEKTVYEEVGRKLVKMIREKGQVQHASSSA